jgi:hypothetical protein
LPPERISESDIAARVFWQTRISIEVIRIGGPCSCELSSDFLG